MRERLNAALLAAGRRRAAVGGEEGGADMVEEGVAAELAMQQTPADQAVRPVQRAVLQPPPHSMEVKS